MFYVPQNRLAHTRFKAFARLPPEFLAHLRCVDRVAFVVAETIFDERYELKMRKCIRAQLL